MTSWRSDSGRRPPGARADQAKTSPAEMGKDQASPDSVVKGRNSISFRGRNSPTETTSRHAEKSTGGIDRKNEWSLRMKSRWIGMFGVFFFVSIALAVTDVDLARMGLTPRPKIVETQGVARLRGEVEIVGAGMFEACAPWLNEIVEKQIGPAAPDGGKSAKCRVELVRRKLKHGPESFRLEITDGRVRLTAGEAAGMFRALGRLAMILDSGACDHRDGALVCPALRVEDWPDIGLRGMDLQMAWSPHEQLIHDTVDVLAKLGYNLVGYEVGARYEYRSHPECRKPGRLWNRAEMRRLIAHARARGITPIPCLNAIGHADRAPRVFMLPDRNPQRRVMDLTNPKFYPTFFDLLDELIDLFEQPPFIHLGTDECTAALQRLAALRTRKPEDLYAEFVNRVAAHLKKKGVRAVIWSDMLLRRGAFPHEPSNATPKCPTDLALDKISKDVIIDYWRYHASSCPGLKLFRKKGFPTWVSPWYDAKGVAQICRQAREVGAAAVFGTTWTDPSRVPHGIVLTAEYAWNASEKNGYVTYEPYCVGNALYCGRSEWGRRTRKPFPFRAASICRRGR